jgi:hypothetical protein
MAIDRFAHPSEREYAALLDVHGIPWEYEPRTFVLEHAPDGRLLEAVTPDFYLPFADLYVECTEMKPSSTSAARSSPRCARSTGRHALEPEIRAAVHSAPARRSVRSIAELSFCAETAPRKRATMRPRGEITNVAGRAPTPYICAGCPEPA